MWGLQIDYGLDDWKMILATLALLMCMIWDIGLNFVKDYIKVPSWIPGNLFVLNSLTIQILVNVDIEKGNVFNPSDENSLRMLVKNQLRNDAARLTRCVFVGCILPGIAMEGTEAGWTYVAALFVNFLFHIYSEIYALRNANNSTVKREAGPWFVSSDLLLFAGASSLILLLGGVMLTANMGRRLARYDICEISFKDARNEGNGSETLIRKVEKSWAVVRFWKTECFACNSAFSPGAGMIVTICVAVMAAKVASLSSLLPHNNGGGKLIFFLQCAFILVGWILMVCRWFKAALYCGSSLNKEFFSHISGSFLAPLVIYAKLFGVGWLILFLPVTLAVSLLWLFCFICWCFSALFGSLFVRCISKFDNEAVSEHDEYSKHGSIMDGMQLNKEETNFFWMVNKKSLHRIKRMVNEVSNIEQNCKGLLSIMGDTKLEKNQRLRLGGRNRLDWMGALSGIFSAVADAEIGEDLGDALAAYEETKDVLKFVDCPNNIFLDPLNIFGTMNFDSFFKSLSYEIKMYDVERKLKQSRQRHIQTEKDLRTSLEKEQERLKRKHTAEDRELTPEEVEGKLTTEERVEQELTPEERKRLEEFVIKVNTINRSCEEMFNSPLITIDESSYLNLGEKLRRLVGHVIVSCLLEASDVLLKCTKQWAQNLDEAKMVRGIEIAGKVSALLGKLVRDADNNVEENEQVPSQSEARASEGNDIS